MKRTASTIILYTRNISYSLLIYCYQIKVYGEPLLSEMWNLVDCIRGDGEPLVTIEDGINALKLVEAARKGIETGKVIELEV